jgi:hypothetical protein
VIGAPAAGDVGLERAARRVEAVGQQLDCEVVVGPAAVDLVAAVVDVGTWEGEAVAAQQREELVLEGADRDVRAERAGSFAAPFLRGLRAMQSSTSSGPVPWIAQASW